MTDNLTQDARKELLDVFSQLAASIAEQHARAKTELTRSSLRDALHRLCRDAENFAARNVSKRAQGLADELRLGDLRRFHWDDQRKMERSRRDGRFLWEHYVPAVDLRDEILALPVPTVAATRAVLEKARIVWVLRDENDVLNDKGHGRWRPDPAAAYRDAGIELAYDWADESWIRASHDRVATTESLLAGVFNAIDAQLVPRPFTLHVQQQARIRRYQLPNAPGEWNVVFGKTGLRVEHS